MIILPSQNNKSAPIPNSSEKSENYLKITNLKTRISKNTSALTEATSNTRLAKANKIAAPTFQQKKDKNYYQKLMQKPHKINKPDLIFLKSSAPIYENITEEQRKESDYQSNILKQCIANTSITAQELIESLLKIPEQQIPENFLTSELHEILSDALNETLIVGSSVHSVLVERDIIQNKEVINSDCDLDLYAPCKMEQSLIYKIQSLVIESLANIIISCLQKELASQEWLHKNKEEMLHASNINFMIKDKAAITACARQLMHISIFNVEPGEVKPWLLIQIGKIDLKIGEMSRPYAFLADSLFINRDGEINSFEATTQDAFKKSVMALEEKSLSTENISNISNWIWKFTLRKISLGWELTPDTRQYIFEYSKFDIATLKKIISSSSSTIKEQLQVQNTFIREIPKYIYHIEEKGSENKIKDLINEIKSIRPDIPASEWEFNKKTKNIEKYIPATQTLILEKNLKPIQSNNKITKQKSKISNEKKIKNNRNHIKLNSTKIRQDSQYTTLFTKLMSYGKNNPQMIWVGTFLSLYLLKQLYQTLTVNKVNVAKTHLSKIPTTKNSISIQQKQTLELALSKVNPSASLYTTLECAEKINELFTKEELNIFNQWHISSVAQWGVFPCTNLPYKEFEFLANHEIPERINRAVKSDLQLIHVENHSFQMLCDAKAIRHKHQKFYQQPNAHIPLERIFPKDYYEFEAFLFSATHPNPVSAMNLALMHHVATTSMIPFDPSFFRVTIQEFTTAFKIVNELSKDPEIKELAHKYEVPDEKIINSSGKFLELNSQLFLSESNLDIKNKIISMPLRTEFLEFFYYNFKKNNQLEIFDLILKHFILISRQAVANSALYTIEKPIPQIAHAKLTQPMGSLKPTEWDKSIAAWYDFHREWVANKK